GLTTGILVIALACIAFFRPAILGLDRDESSNLRTKVLTPDGTVPPRSVVEVPSTDDADKGDYALEFDGATSYVSIPSLNRDDDGAATIEAWVRGLPPDEGAKAIFVVGGKDRIQLAVNPVAWLAHNLRNDLELASLRLPPHDAEKWFHLAFVVESR